MHANFVKMGLGLSALPAPRLVRAVNIFWDCKMGVIKSGKSDYVNNDVMSHILFALTPTNRLVMLVALCTGLRVSDVLALRSDELSERMTIVEQKTGKKRRIRFDNALYNALRRQMGAVWVFPGRLDPQKKRTRQAVWRDLRRVADFYRVPKQIKITPHSARKIYAVKQYRRTCDVDAVRRLLNHGDKCVTLLYATADILSRVRHEQHPEYF